MYVMENIIFKAATPEQIANRPKIKADPFDDIPLSLAAFLGHEVDRTMARMIIDVLNNNGVPHEYLRSDIQSCHAATNSQQAKA